MYLEVRNVVPNTISVAHLSQSGSPTIELRGYEMKIEGPMSVVFIWNNKTPKEEKLTFPWHRIRDIVETLEPVEVEYA